MIDLTLADLCAWLRQNSSGVYRNCNHAADIIELLANCDRAMPMTTKIFAPLSPNRLLSQMNDIQSLPVWPQSQESLREQMAVLIQVANRLGLYDASDAITQKMPNLATVQHGCHVDLFDGFEPDGCVIDEGRINDCIHAKKGMRKEQCEYWRIVKGNVTNGNI